MLNLPFIALQEESEADFKNLYPDHYATFSDIEGVIDDQPPGDDMDVDHKPAQQAGGEGEEDAAASEGQARSSAAKALLDGELLADIVRLHAATYTALAAAISRAGAAATGAGVTAKLPEGLHTPVSTTDTFQLSYHLGTELLVAMGGGVDVAVDEHTLTGHLYRLCHEHARIAKAAAINAAAAVAEAEGRPRKARATGRIIFEEDGSDEGVDKFHGMGLLSLFGAAEGAMGVDINAPCVEEAALLQEPVAAMARRLRELLEEFPDHPVLAQLAAICARCLSLPLTAPLKTALTGLELLLARAQVWEDTAAKYVSIKAQLTAVAALATRWRKLELACWRNTLKRTAVTHARGAFRSWFHLYRLLIEGMVPGAEAAASGDGEPKDGLVAATGTESAAAAHSLSGALPSAAPGSTANAMAAASSEAEAKYRQIASTLEAFVQTSTLGELSARLELLQGFLAHLQVRGC